MSDDLLRDLLDCHEDTKPERNEIQRAPFGYIGGKSESVKHLNKLLPVRDAWCDHFSGSCVVTLNRPESKLEVINDRYSGIINFYRCLRDKAKLDKLMSWLEFTVNSREEFLDCRDTWATETDDVTRAAKWFYMVRNSINSCGRSWARSLTGVGFRNRIPSSLELFLPIHFRIKNAQIENMDAELCAKEYDSHGCVHYFDPPYLDTDCTSYLTPEKWRESNLESLLRTIGGLKGFVALSHYDNKLINSQSYWCKKHSWNVSTTSKVTRLTCQISTECLWIKDK